MIRLSVPGELAYRDVVLRVVASSCKLMRSRQHGTQEASHEDHDGELATQVVSAVSEVFNNIAIHGYRNRAPGNVDVEIEVTDDELTLRLSDTGASFDLAAVRPPALAALPESHMGLYIVRSFMDDVRYEPGDGATRPNVLTLIKRR
jgi:serine/threonine-protein kinase RsbW